MWCTASQNGIFGYLRCLPCRQETSEQSCIPRCALGKWEWLYFYHPQSNDARRTISALCFLHQLHWFFFEERCGRHAADLSCTNFYQETRGTCGEAINTEVMKIQKKPSPETETASLSYIWNKRRCATRWSAANAASSPGMAMANMSHPSMTLSRRGSTAPANHGQASTQRRKDPHRPRKKVSCLAEISACPISSSWSISWTDPWTCFAGEAKAWIECKEITSFATIRLKELTTSRK